MIKSNYVRLFHPPLELRISRVLSEPDPNLFSTKEGTLEFNFLSPLTLPLMLFSPKEGTRLGVDFVPGLLLLTKIPFFETEGRPAHRRLIHVKNPIDEVF